VNLERAAVMQSRRRTSSLVARGRQDLAWCVLLSSARTSEVQQSPHTQLATPMATPMAAPIPAPIMAPIMAPFIAWWAARPTSREVTRVGLGQRLDRSRREGVPR
jgi:hypothetical protein